MTPERSVTLRIPDPLLAALARATRREEQSVAEFIRAAVADRAAELDGEGPRDPVGTLRRALRREFTSAIDWLDLQSRLRAEKFVLREIEGVLWLHTWPMEWRLVPIDRLGFDRDALTLLFRASFPTHGKSGTIWFRASVRAA